MHISVFFAACNLHKNHNTFPESINAGGGREDTVTLLFLGYLRFLKETSHLKNC